MTTSKITKLSLPFKLEIYSQYVLTSVQPKYRPKWRRLHKLMMHKRAHVFNCPWCIVVFNSWICITYIDSSYCESSDVNLSLSRSLSK